MKKLTANSKQLTAPKKTGIFGGSFNPIHTGHIALARQLREAAGLDEVWLMVSPQNPLKQQATLLDDDLRLQMAKAALADEPFIEVSDYEFHLPRPSYTWNTLQALKDDYPDREFVLLIGGDNWESFPHWYRADDIIRNYQLIVYPRRGSDIDLTSLPSTVTVIEAELLDISSTDIRRRVRRHQSIKGMVPDSILDAVTEHYS
jgi:nicotinate-nucleotide adenylyltransferase